MKEGGVAILGLGNVLMGDDAIGPHVIDALQSGYFFAEDVTVEDLGTPGLDLAPFLMGREAVIFVDAVRAAAPPGSVRTYRRDEIVKGTPQPRISPHDPALKESLLFMEFSGLGPKEVLFVGVVPRSTESRVGLSPEVRAAIPAAVAEVMRELARLGRPARPVEGAVPKSLWWEQPVV